MTSRRPWLAPSFLLLLAVLAFWPVVFHPTETLYSDTNDLLAEHLPAKLFLVRSLRQTGELPLWNPEQYAGSPFVHDIQVGLFYPPHLPLYWMAEPAVGPFASWLVFAHVVLAGWLMYAYGRHAGLGELGAFTAGFGFMLAPRWLMQLLLAGHTVTAGIAWLPLVVLCVELAIQRRSLRWTLGGGIAYALLILGTHPQWTFYGSLLIGLWPLRLLAESTASRERERPEALTGQSAVAGASPPVAHAPGSPSQRAILVRWLVVEAAVVLIGVALCTVQLLPTIEAAGQTSRSRGMGQSWSVAGAVAAATTLIGPFPERVAEPVHWEARGGIGLTWAILALAAWSVGGRRARIPALVALGMLAFALGGSVLFDKLPGFSSFRMPTRMLLTLTFPVAFLAGLAVQSLAGEWPGGSLRRATAIVLALAAGPGLLSVLAGRFPALDQTSWAWRVYWVAVPAAWLTFLWLAPRLSPAGRGRACAALLAADVLAFALPYPATRPLAEVFPQSPLINYIRANNPDGHRVYDPEWDDTGGCLFGPGSPGASVHGVPSVRGFNPLDVARYRQFLAFIADVGEPQQAFSGNFTHPVTRKFDVRNRRLLDLLGVRYGVATPGEPGFNQDWPPRPSDESPRCYNFLGPGVQRLAPLTVYENDTVLPRAFVVVQAFREEAAEADVLEQLKRLDLRTFATLADWDPKFDRLPEAPGGPGPARIRAQEPNRVAIELDGRTGGLLVLTDPWYPGWVCRVDGTEVPVWRADYAFRGVMVPAGTREVVFRFEPMSYRLGKWLSLTAIAGVGLAFLAVLVRRRFTALTGSRWTGR